MWSAAWDEVNVVGTTRSHVILGKLPVGSVVYKFGLPTESTDPPAIQLFVASSLVKVLGASGPPKNRRHHCFKLSRSFYIQQSRSR